MNILIIDGQGGKIGKLLVEAVKANLPAAQVTAVGTNSIATSNMIKGGADYAATGENSVVVACKNADVVIGPLGIVIADSLLGEITAVMATAVGSCRAKKLLIPINKCNNVVVGASDLSVSELIDKTLALLLPKD